MCVISSPAVCVCCLLQLHEGVPYLDTSVADEEGAGLLQGRAGYESGAINATPLDLGLLRDSIEDQHADRRLQDLQVITVVTRILCGVAGFVAQGSKVIAML